MSIGGATTATMAITECLDAGLSTIGKVAMQRGMSNLVYISYSNSLGFFFLLLPSLFLYSAIRAPPPLSFPILCRIFVLAQISCFLQVFVNFGIWYSSPTLSSAMLDLTPAFTFLLALISRMETLNVRAKSCWAKSVGTIVSIIGALTVSLYKGVPITKPPFLHAIVNSQQPDWAIGGTLLAGAALCLSLLYIVQTWIMRDYPEELIVTLLTCFFVAFQSTVVALVVENDPSVWTLKFDVELLTICCSAIFSVAIRNTVHAWACKRKGPVYVSMFKPLSMVFALIMGVSFLGDTLYLGSLVGAAIIAIGFYTVIWGKAQEEKKMEDRNRTSGLEEEEESSSHVPLLRNKNMEI